MQNNIRKYIKIHFENKYPVVEGLKFDKISICPYYDLAKCVINPLHARPQIFWRIWASIMPTGALALCVARSSAVMILTVIDSDFQNVPGANELTLLLTETEEEIIWLDLIRCWWFGKNCEAFPDSRKVPCIYQYFFVKCIFSVFPGLNGLMPMYDICV